MEEGAADLALRDNEVGIGENFLLKAVCEVEDKAAIAARENNESELEVALLVEILDSLWTNKLVILNTGKLPWGILKTGIVVAVEEGGNSVVNWVHLNILGINAA